MTTYAQISESSFLTKRPREHPSTDENPSKKICTLEESFSPLFGAPSINNVPPKFMIPHLEQNPAHVREQLAAYARILQNPTQTSLYSRIHFQMGKLHQKLGEHNEAIEYFTKYLYSDSQNSECLALRGESFGYLGDFNSARKDLSEAHKLAPKSISVLLSLIAILMDGFQEIDEAQRLLRIASEITPSHLKLLCYTRKLNQILKQSKKPTINDLTSNSHSAALRKLVPINSLNLNPLSNSEHFADSAFLSARVALKQRKFNEALEMLNRAIAANPNHLPSLLCRGGIFKELGRLEDALMDFRCALKVNPTNSEALFGTAYCEFTFHRFDQALKLLEGISSLSPVWINSIFLRGEIRRKMNCLDLALQDFDHVIEFYKRMVQNNNSLLHNPKNKRAYVRALARRGLVRFGMFQKSFLAKQSHSQPRSSISFGAVPILQASGPSFVLNPLDHEEEFEPIMKDFRCAMQILDDSFVFNSLVGIFLDSGMVDKAEVFLKQSVLCSVPDDIDTLTTQGRLYRVQKQLDKAEMVFKRIIELNSQFYSAYYHLIGIYAEKKDFSLALETIDRVSLIHSDSQLAAVRAVVVKLCNNCNNSVTKK